ncbi:hypothetical protein PVAND_005345 [Polypedilum vanderplanki]|uniref:peptidylprolyl isomerase n=1 Tax=Polypedilum vanderplanki TaxID=319348 RepID=A0A9J6BZN7_POLVA|nr:hypothetical protein PVAND_005345 [Polypedilum vanderplanki]
MPEVIDLSNDGGVLKEILKEGEGKEQPCDGCVVSCHYTGTLLDGTKFDSSLDRNEPFEFKLGKGQVIRSWDIGVASMHKGEKCMLTCAPEYAYGVSGSPPNIPPNATLKFELELLGWKGEDVSKNGDNGIERYVIVKSDKKKTPNDGARVKCKIVGSYEGRVFEERDVEFNIGEGEDYNIIPGVETALEKMHEQETSRLIIKPKYAFGSEGNEQFKIPPDATVEYLVTLHEFEREVEAWKLDAEESLKQAKIFKEKGTNYYKSDRFQQALKFYKKGLSFLSNCDTSVEGEARTVSVSIYLNKALCYQKLNDYDEMRRVCNEALSMEPKNIKALYRRGQAYFTLGEIENALADFEAVHEIEPENKAAINQITICKQKIKSYVEEEKKRYKSMLSRYCSSDGSKEDVPQLEDPFANVSKFGEWTEEERSHTITKFEEENPDVILCDNVFFKEELKNM